MTFKVVAPIKQVKMAERLLGIQSLYNFLSNWRIENKNAFRLDGKTSIGPANPAQWVFFEIEGFQDALYSGKELNRVVTGTDWNGVYYLTASTQGLSIDCFLELCQKNNFDVNKIFKLGYTAGKENLSSKRRLYLDTTSEANAGWFCKQHKGRGL